MVRPYLLALAVVVFAAAVIYAAPPEGPGDPPATTRSAPEEAEIQRRVAAAIAQLGSDDFKRREQASGDLEAIGRPAVRALRQVLGSPDPEVADRARSALKRIRLGQGGDLPEPLRAALQRVSAQGRDALDEALAFGPEAYVPLCHVCAAQPALRSLAENTAYGDPANFSVRTGLQELLISMLLKGHTEQALVDAEDAAMSGLDVAVTNYAWLLSLGGQSDAFIQRWDGSSFDPELDPGVPRVMAWLYRSRDDFPAAVRWAQKADDQTMLRGLWRESGQWQVLADWAEKQTATDPRLNPPAMNVAIYRFLAGQSRQAEEALATWERMARAGDQAAAGQGWGWRPFPNAVVPLLVNGQADRALQLCKEIHQPGPAMEILLAQQRFAEGLQLQNDVLGLLPSATGAAATAPNGDARAPQWHYAETLATALAELGIKDQARAWFAYAFDAAPHAHFRGEIIFKEWQAGLNTQAGSHLDRLVKLSASDPSELSVWSMLSHGTIRTAICWRCLRQRYPQDSPQAAFERLMDLAEGRTDPAGLENVMADGAALLEKHFPTTSSANLKDQSRSTPAEKQKQRRAQLAFDLDDGSLANLCGCYHRYDLALKYLAPVTQLRGDGGANVGFPALTSKQWKEAADWLASDPMNQQAGEITLVRGAALNALGQRQEGQALMHRGWMMILDPARRGWFHAGTTEMAKFFDLEEFTWLVPINPRDLHELGRPSATGWYLIDVTDFAAAAEDCRLQWLDMADPFDPEQVPARSIGPLIQMLGAEHALLARQWFAAGKIDAGMTEARFAMQLVPGSVEMAGPLTADLDRLGQKAQADAIFAPVWALHLQTLAQFPLSAARHRQLAWLAALSKRNLGEGLAHAQAAIRLEPRDAGMTAVLAEVYAAMGQREQATTTYQRARALSPFDPWIKSRQKRL